jgi:hypothetical protein
MIAHKLSHETISKDYMKGPVGAGTARKARIVTSVDDIRKANYTRVPTPAHSMS